MQKYELKLKNKQLEQLQIFKTLCPKEKWIEKDDCHVCNQKIKKQSGNPKNTYLW